MKIDHLIETIVGEKTIRKEIGIVYSIKDKDIRYDIYRLPPRVGSGRLEGGIGVS